MISSKFAIYSPQSWVLSYCGIRDTDKREVGGIGLITGGGASKVRYNFENPFQTPENRVIIKVLQKVA